MSRPDLSGTTVGNHFALKNRLGSGHFGDVYYCENTNMAHDSALKVVPIANATGVPALEAKLLNLSTHAHIVKVRSATDWQDNTGADYLLIEMEFVPGGSLEDGITKEISIGETVSVMKNVLFALDSAHPSIIHRDVKPANILLGGGGKLSDFGIAMFAPTGAAASDLSYPLNRAPECFGPTAVFNVSTDVFAAGLTLFRALNLATNWQSRLIAQFVTGQAVLKHLSAGTLVTAMGFHPRVPPSLQKIVKKACAKDPAKRYGTALAFRDALEALRVVRDWHRLGPTKWGCTYNGVVEHLEVSAKRGAFDVDYTRNGRRKQALCRRGLSGPDALKYVYETIAATTLN